MSNRDSGVTVMWFRRDIRTHDHPALTAAVARGAVIPLFVLDNALLHGKWPSPNRVWFMLESLRQLDTSLRSIGGRLHIRHGKPSQVVPTFARDCSADAVFVSRDYSPYARRRDAAVAASLQEAGIPWQEHPGHLIVEPEAMTAAGGSAYRVYSPFRRAWEQAQRRDVLPAPSQLTTPEVEAGTIPSLAELGFDEREVAELLEPGERAARERLDAWSISSALDVYDEQRDVLAASGTSRLSQDLRWGLLSPLEVEARTAGASAGRLAFGRELAWRDFYYHVLWHLPHVTRGPMRPEAAPRAYLDDDAAFDTWREGRTGYPVVDAAMRQLLALGWMHNRARMITASFLSKHLLLDWRRGEAHFGRNLVDGDLASNNGGWQWAASTGADAQPYFRVFNPVLQGKKFDSDGAYVRRWVPELRDVPDRYVHEPWLMPDETQRAARCRIGVDYPPPVVDHKLARERALRAFGKE